MQVPFKDSALLLFLVKDFELTEKGWYLVVVEKCIMCATVSRQYYFTQ